MTSTTLRGEERGREGGWGWGWGVVGVASVLDVQSLFFAPRTDIMLIQTINILLTRNLTIDAGVRK